MEHDTPRPRALDLRPLGFRWPFVTRRTLARVEADAIERTLQSAADTHRAAVLKLDEEHEDHLDALRNEHVNAAKRHALSAVVAVHDAVMRERARCAEAASRIPTSGRPAIIRQRVLDAIQNEAPPTVRHPLVPDEENPTLSRAATTSKSNTTALPTA